MPGDAIIGAEKEIDFQTLLPACSMHNSFIYPKEYLCASARPPLRGGNVLDAVEMRVPDSRNTAAEKT